MLRHAGLRALEDHAPSAQSSSQLPLVLAGACAPVGCGCICGACAAQRRTRAFAMMSAMMSAAASAAAALLCAWTFREAGGLCVALQSRGCLQGGGMAVASIGLFWDEMRAKLSACCVAIRNRALSQRLVVVEQSEQLLPIVALDRGF
eukprot:126290-Rhodomonas_salina.1